MSKQISYSPCPSVTEKWRMPALHARALHVKVISCIRICLPFQTNQTGFILLRGKTAPTLINSLISTAIGHYLV